MISRVLHLVLLLLPLVHANAAELTLGAGEWLREPQLATLLEAADEAGSPDAGTARYRVDAPDLPLKNASTSSVRISLGGLAADGSTGRFGAELAIMAADGTEYRLPVSGRRLIVSRVPVLTKSVVAGTLVTEEMIDVAELQEATLPADALRNAAAMVGMAATRRLSANRPLRQGDLRTALAIQTGEAVALIFRRGGLKMAAAGRALEGAVAGAPIRVANIDSQQEVAGIVLGPGRVDVSGVER